MIENGAFKSMQGMSEFRASPSSGGIQVRICKPDATTSHPVHLLTEDDAIGFARYIAEQFGVEIRIIPRTTFGSAAVKVAR